MLMVWLASVLLRRYSCKQGSYSFKKSSDSCKQDHVPLSNVIPVKAGIPCMYEWIPAFAGAMTSLAGSELAGNGVVAMTSFAVIKKVCLFSFFIIFSSACTTIYKPSHRFMDQTYKPVKKGVFELEVHKELVFANSEGIKSRKRAYQIGRNNVKRSIKEFCNGEFSIQNISKEKEQTGVESITSTTKNSNTSGQFNVMGSEGYMSHSNVGDRRYRCGQKNIFGSYPSGGGCNSFGCWMSGGAVILLGVGMPEAGVLLLSVCVRLLKIFVMYWKTEEKEANLLPIQVQVFLMAIPRNLRRIKCRSIQKQIQLIESMKLFLFNAVKKQERVDV